MSEGVKIHESYYHKKKVLNIFIRRGVQVYKTVGYTISYLMDERKEWNIISELSFDEKVED